MGTAAILAAISFGGNGCGGSGGAPSLRSPPATPPPPIALVDPVDYGALGSGRLCFERIVSNSGPGGGVFVIDAGARRAWGFFNGDYIGGVFDEPAISPDGLRIAYSSLTDLVTFYDIYVIPADGGFPVRALGGSESESLPAWTPGSELICCPTGDGQTRETVSVTGDRAVAASGGALLVFYRSGYPTRVYEGPQVRLDAPAFSPDGTELAWVRVRDVQTGGTGMDVVVGEPDGSHPEKIATLPLPGGLMRWSGGNNLTLAWSPDGRRLAFIRPESPETAHVWVVGRDGTGLSQITSAPGVGDRSVSWSYLPRP